MVKASDLQQFIGNDKRTGLWRQPLLALGSLLAWALFLYRDTALAMATLWYRSETFTHGFLVPPIVFWLIWRKRQAIAAVSPLPLPSVLILAGGAAFCWLLGELVAVNAVTQFAFVSLLVLAVPAVMGVAVTGQIIFPLAFLFFCVPVGEVFMPQLMQWTADFTVQALRLSGIPVYREGLQFVIPSGNWSVVEACSGVRYLIASLTVGTLFAYLNYQSTKKRLLFVLVSILVPVLANWLRAYMIVMLGHLSGNKLAAGVDHLIYGWAFFGIVIMLMFIVGARWADPEVRVDADRAVAVGQLQKYSNARLWACTFGFAAMLAAPHLAIWGVHQAETTGPVTLTAPSVLNTDWKADLANQGKTFKPAFQSPSAEVNAIYAGHGHNVGLYLGYYRHQDYERKLVSSINILVNSKDANWTQVGGGAKVISIDGKQTAVRTAELRSATLGASATEGRMAVAQIYWINGTLTASDYLAKVYSALYRLAGRGDDSAVIIVYTAKELSGGGEALLETFLVTHYPAINEVLVKARGSR